MTHHTAHRATAVLSDASVILDRIALRLDILDILDDERERSRRRRRRALELSRDAGMGAWSCHFVRLERAPDGQPWRVVVAVPSRTTPYLDHRITVALPSVQASCSCAAASYGRACPHAGAAVLYALELVAAFAEAQRVYWRSFADEANARALAPSL